MKTCCPLLLLCLLAACNSSGDGQDAKHEKEGSAGASWTPPPPGTVVAADSMLITDDPLNRFYFTVKLLPGKQQGQGAAGFIYDVQADFGPNTADGRIAMPRGGRNLRPLLRPAPDGSYSYIIGFIPGPEYGGDTAFHEYYEVRGAKSSIEIKPLKGYVLE